MMDQFIKVLFIMHIKQNQQVLIMRQFRKVLLAIDNAHTVPQRSLDCKPGVDISSSTYQ